MPRVRVVAGLIVVAEEVCAGGSRVDALFVISRTIPTMLFWMIAFDNVREGDVGGDDNPRPQNRGGWVPLHGKASRVTCRQR